MRGGRGARTKEQEASASQTAQEKPAEDVGGTGVAGPEEIEGERREPTLADLAAILRAYMGQQEARDEKQKETAARQEQRFKALQHQFQMLQLEVQAQTSPLPDPPATDSDPDLEALPSRSHLQTQVEPVAIADASMTATGQVRSRHGPRLEKLTENDDIEHFLITFERIGAACRWPRTDWVFHLMPLLTGRARSAYVHMDIDDS